LNLKSLASQFGVSLLVAALGIGGYIWWNKRQVAPVIPSSTAQQVKDLQQSWQKAGVEIQKITLSYGALDKEIENAQKPYKDQLDKKNAELQNSPCAMQGDKRKDDKCLSYQQQQQKAYADFQVLLVKSDPCTRHWYMFDRRKFAMNIVQGGDPVCVETGKK